LIHAIDSEATAMNRPTNISLLKSRYILLLLARRASFDIPREAQSSSRLNASIGVKKISMLVLKKLAENRVLQQ
jgi:hypothetical protein